MKISEVVRRPIVMVPRSKFSYRDVNDDSLYHITSYARARQILATGFQINSAPTFTNYSNISKGKIFFVERDGVQWWIDRVEEHLFNNSDRPSAVAVLRVAKSDLMPMLRKDPVGTQDSHHDCYFITANFPA